MFNDGGWVIDLGIGELVFGVYVVGWIKCGFIGFIGMNKFCFM